MKIRDVVNFNVARIAPTATISQAAELLSMTQASDLMVVDTANNFLGVLSEGDVLRALMPNIEELVAEGSLTSGYEIFQEKGKELAAVPIETYVIKSALTLAPGDDVLRRAAGLMVKNQIRRLPVIEDGKLLGTVSRADVCRSTLRN